MFSLVARFLRPAVWRAGLLGLAGAAAVAPLSAVERVLRIEVPAAAVAGQPLPVVIVAATGAGGGEQVGFLQADVSLDGGRTWAPLCYLANAGPQVAHPVAVTPGGPGTVVRIRARAAFRDGLAGDVDYTGAALRWNRGWRRWDEPPARHAAVPVTAR